MRKGLLIGCLLLIVLGIVATALPELTVDEPTYDFGSIGQGYMVKHTFLLQNTGDQMLEIFRVRASCGCTTTALSTTQLAPGESVSLEVNVLADHGTTKNVAIRIYTNAPDEHGTRNDENEIDLTLRVHGVLTPQQEYEIAPNELAYDMMLLIDVRDAADYDANHLIGAINIPASDLPDRMSSLSRGALLIVHDLEGEAADAAVQMLLSAGYRTAYYLQGGLGRWVEVRGDLYMVHATPLPVASGNVSGGSSGRPYNQGTLDANFYVLIDLREPEQYVAEHIIGAINVPAEQLPQWFDRLPVDAKIIVYGEASLTLSAHQSLVDAGYSRPFILLGGLDEWMVQYGVQFMTSD